MKATGTTLTYSTDKTIKAFSGSLGDSLLRLPTTLDQVKIGDLKFVTKNTTLLSGATNREMKVLEGSVLVSIEGFWHTLNTITVKVLANTAPDQQAFFTIQHGSQSQVALNAQESYVTLLHIPGVPLIVTASNFSTGATSFKQVLPVAGQLYSLTSVSNSVETGAITTTGGEQLGELKEVCVQEAFKYDSSSPVLFTWEGIFHHPEVAVTVGQPTEKETNQFLLNFYIDALAGTNLSGMFPVNQVGLFNTEYNKVLEIMSRPTTYYNLSKQAATNILVDEFYTPTTTASYSFMQGTPNGTEDPAPLKWANYTNDVSFILNAGRTYITEIKLQVTQAKLTITQQPTQQPGGSWTARATLSYKTLAQCRVYGPLAKECIATQTIDTRYTTPVVTTDTRRTIHSIVITLTPLN